jgi:hypothetical protein
VTIVHNNLHDTVKVQTVIYSNDRTVNIIASGAMISMAEANVDMILDQGREYNTKADIEAAFAQLHEQARDLIDEAMAELRERIMDRLKEMSYTVQVRRLDYDENGELDDICINLDIK